MTNTPEITPDHEGMTRLLFVDAIVGVGFPHQDIGIEASKNGLALFVGSHSNEAWAWSRTALGDLPTAVLQDMYTSLKFYEVTRG